MKKYLVITCDTLGKDEELGTILMRVFLTNLAMAPSLPESITLMNAGVKLACEGSDLLAELRAVEDRGTLVHSCGTCLDYYGIREQLRVGDGGTMAETIASLMAAQDAVVI